MISCPRCKSGNDDDQAACTQCGCDLRAAKRGETSPKSLRSVLTSLLIILLLVLFIALVALIVLYVQGVQKLAG
jgi:uncharacterized membrane protein YvbJ